MGRIELRRPRNSKGPIRESIRLLWSHQYYNFKYKYRCKNLGNSRTIYYELRQCGVGLSLLLGVERQLISEMGEGGMGRGGMVIQKYRGIERSTRIKVSTKGENRFTPDN